MHPAPAPWQHFQRWLVWLLFGSAWTSLLLIPLPAQVWFVRGPTASYWRFPLAKTVHVLAYLLWTVLSGRLGVVPRYRWLILFLVMAHAPVSELIQRWIPSRTGTLEDVVFDHLGVALGLAFSWRWWSAPEKGMKRADPDEQAEQPTAPLPAHQDQPEPS